MAWQDVPEVPLTRFLKMKEVFSRIGDKFLGIYQAQSEGTYGTDYVFSTALGPVSLTIKGALKKQLDSTPGGLTPGLLVALQFKGEKDVGKDSPMRQFKVGVDRDYSGPPPKNGPNVRLPERGAAPAQSDEDLPF